MPIPVLPENQQNARLLGYLRSRAKPAKPDGWPLGEWELHTHPDLMERLKLLGPDNALHSAYGVPVLASPRGIAAAVAMGTHILLVRLPSIPEDLAVGEPIPLLTDRAWKSVSPWQGQLRGDEGTRRLVELVQQALARARR